MTTVPRLQPCARGDVWALSAAGAVALDARAIQEARVPQAVLMENAGRAAAHVLHRVHGGSRVVGVIGTGNNGGDALVVLRTLAAWGYRTSAVLLGDRCASGATLDRVDDRLA
jgi:NAD(P)H-hydrate epimerase